MSNTLRQLSNEMADLVEGAAESVVRVDARRRLPASGTVWAGNLIVTAHHVVEFEDDIVIGAPNVGRLRAELVGRDPRLDLALLRVDENLKPADWAREQELRPGELALALGRPRRKARASLGIVSGVASRGDIERQIKGMKAQFWKGMKGDKSKWKKRKWRKRFAWEGGGLGVALAGGVIHSDLVMYPGFSGGPLLGVDGKVHGMNTSGFRGGASLAIPLASLRESVATLLAKGKAPTGYLGVGLQTAQLPAELAEALGQEAGLLIVSVEAGGPADQAGWLVGDILLALDGGAVEQVDELQILLHRLEAGHAVSAQIARGGSLQEIDVVIGER